MQNRGESIGKPLLYFSIEIVSFQEKESVEIHDCIHLVAIRHLQIKDKESVKLFNEVEVIPW